MINLWLLETGCKLFTFQFMMKLFKSAKMKIREMRLSCKVLKYSNLKVCDPRSKHNMNRKTCNTY